MQALVTSLPKPGRNSTDMSNYRPLSLLATEYKILSKALANRIQPYLTTLIHGDQCGFLPNRSTSLNTRRLHYVMKATPAAHQNAGCLALDLRQAFDSISWDYMFAALQRFGFPEAYLKWVRLLYTSPTARASTGRHISRQYTIHRVTRQGCPLSPLLFVLALEPLAVALRQSAELLGIPIDGTAHLTSIYADDILLYLRDLTTTPLPTILSTFEQISGLAINPRKSLAAFFQDGLHPDELRFGTYTLPVAHTTFKYLGIQIYRTQADQLEGNLLKAIAALCASVAFWISLPLSVMGRIAISNMVVLPRLLYYFVNLPVVVPQSTYNTLNTILVGLIWRMGRRRVSLQKLQLESHKGGLGVPDFRAYYYACQLQWLSFWTAGKNLQEIGNTSRDLDRGTLHSLILPQAKIPLEGPPLLKTALQCWKKALLYTSAVTPYSTNIPLLGIFPPPGVGSQGLGSTPGQRQVWRMSGFSLVMVTFSTMKHLFRPQEHQNTYTLYMQ